MLRENWFYEAFAKITEKNIPILGYNNLTKLKYNYNPPKVQLRTSSGIDWFDLQIKISYGNQQASLKDIRKAIINKQNYVVLGDGTLGLLPEDWLKKYSSVFRLGKVENDNINISKKLFSVVEALYGEIDNEQIKQELDEKRQKLLKFQSIKDIAPPANMNATLRDYQLEGYKWLNFLDEYSWGGCLADDMGLGKTLQVLAFLQHQKNLYPGIVNLIVLPTTLVFNWEAEAAKFCPDLKLHIYRGLERIKDHTHFDKYDLIITTYGTLRSDIELFVQYHFHYLILDESQAIKNPTAQISKAVKLIQAKNRIVMTGTPIENSTFDLYSQLDFLNPGLLGSIEFFKTEYANAIDKQKDVAKAEELKKIVYPFLLKRTKEEVAKELPDKTETILYCEMGKKQRKVYDTFRKKYHEEISEMIASDGLNKAGFLILEGLLKLRQICDSPALLNEEEDFGDESAKLDEIVREIEENASNHKILIFSQFIKMLQLIKTKLDALNITYEYMDGKTTERKDKVDNFQNNEECRVFLISLKTGGVGLNLTEADYVYLVDPWWNPAVEQQAIDRTHRIGQTKKVFAYKMICKDSIEEKILNLQSKKKEIASDIISMESGFIKKLSQKDIENLFS